MATRLENYVSHGAISNEVPGRVIGKIWFIDADEPLILDLEGDPHRDLAGTHLTFEHCDEEFQEGETAPKIDLLQKGIAGDITASKKVYYQESLLDNPDAHEPSLVNSLCIEWYGKDGERFVIDSISFYLYAGEAVWQMDAPTEKKILAANTKRFHDHIDRIANRISDGDPDDPDEDDQPLDEFQWEQRLKESDRITQAYMEALDKYQDLPNQDKLVAAAMGWSQTSEPSWEATDDDLEDPFGPIDDIDADFDPDSWLEGDDRENENHPLYQRAQDFSFRLLSEAQEMAILESDDSNPGDSQSPVQTLVFGCMDLSAKLAGALNDITHSEPEPGLIVAWLKRGLPIVGSALAAAESAESEGRAPKDWVEGAQKELFEIRAAMLDLIQDLRNQLP